VSGGGLKLPSKGIGVFSDSSELEGTVDELRVGSLVASYLNNLGEETFILLWNTKPVRMNFKSVGESEEASWRKKWGSWNKLGRRGV